MDWGVAGFVVGCLGVVAAFLTYAWSRKPKRLGWRINNFTDVVSERYPEVTVSHRGVALENPALLDFRFHNFGKVEIRVEDFVKESPLQIRVLSHSVVDATSIADGEREVRSDLHLDRDTNIITIGPSLINAGELIRVTMLLDSEEPTSTFTYHVAGRVAGVPRIEKIDRMTRKSEVLESPRIMVCAYLLFLVGLIVYLTTHGAVAAAAFVLALGALTVPLVPDVLRWRQRRVLRG